MSGSSNIGMHNYTPTEERLLQLAERSKQYERHGCMMWFSVVMVGLVALRIVTADAGHSVYAIAFAIALMGLAAICVWFFRFRLNALRLIRKLSQAPSASSAPSAVSNDLEGD